MGAGLNLLLDANALLFWFAAADELSQDAREAIGARSTLKFVSVVTPWELAIKNGLGKLNCGALLDEFDFYVLEQGFLVLPIEIQHAIRTGALPHHHRDPFDRMLVAQAQTEGLAIVSSDPIFEHYGVPRVW